MKARLCLPVIACLAMAWMSSWRRVASVGVEERGAGVVVFLGRGRVSPWKGVKGCQGLG